MNATQMHWYKSRLTCSLYMKLAVCPMAADTETIARRLNRLETYHT